MRLLLTILPFFAIANAQQAEPSMIPSLIMFAIIGCGMYFFMFRPQQKKAKEVQALLSALKKGDEVVMISGIIGRISAVGDNFISLEIANNVEIKVQRQAIASLMPKGSYKGDL